VETPVLAGPVDTVRLFLHVLSAGVWVGGQIVMAGVVQEARKHGGSELVRGLARAFGRVARPAFAMVLATGVWNLLALDVARASIRWMAAVTVMVAAGLLSFAAAELHARARASRVRGALAGTSLLLGLVAMAAGVLSAG
jgi:putative copper export protein